jgi:hypothetical protein
MKKRLSKWPEKVSTSPSGMHLRHYKSQYKPHRYTFEEDSKEKEKVNKQQQTNTKAQLQLINILIANQCTLERWQTVHSILLFKDKHNKYLHCTRNIHIFEANYILILKLKWGQAIQHSEKTKMIHDSQFGCRKQKTAHDPVMIETLLHELPGLHNSHTRKSTFMLKHVSIESFPK